MSNLHSLKISIITVTYNSSLTILETLKSVAKQNYSNIEHIIIDGNSNDNTIEIIKGYPKQISKIVSEPDEGIYDAMNKGIALATGDVIGILNSDDLYYTKEIISLVMNQFIIDETIEAVYGDIVYFKTKNPEKVVRFWKAFDYYDNYFDDGYVIPHPSLFVRKIVYDKIGDYNKNFKISSDYEFMLKAFKVSSFKLMYLNQTLVKMRKGGESTKSFKNTLIANIEIHKSWKNNNLSIPFLFFFKRFLHKFKQIL